MKSESVLREKAVELRKQGKSYKEIQESLKINIPKSTISYWFKNIKFSDEENQKIKNRNLLSIKESRLKAFAVIREKRENYLHSIVSRVEKFSSTLDNKNTAKIALTMLYITEGSRSAKGSVCFGNSDPYIVSLFLRLLRFCYNIDEQKLRCTVQCRADQNIKQLEKFWFEITGINKKQFCKPQFDPRTLGKPTKKPNYKGVCRVQYFSADLSLELKAIAKVIHKGPVV